MHCGGRVALPQHLENVLYADSSQTIDGPKTAHIFGWSTLEDSSVVTTPDNYRVDWGKLLSQIWHKHDV